MNTSRRVFFAVAMAFGTISSTPILALPITELTVFGDSNADIGRVRTELNFGVRDDGQLPPPSTVGDRPSDGPLMPEYVADRIGVHQLNFAFGGATTGEMNLGGILTNHPDLTPTGTLKQVDEFSALLGGAAADPKALYLIWAGGNDISSLKINHSNQDEVDSAVAEADANLREAVARLTALGAKNLVLGARTTRPVYSDAATPADEADPTARSDAAGRQLNSAIQSLVRDLDTTLPSNVHFFDAYAIIREIIDGAGTNGFAPYSSSQFCVGNTDCSMLVNYDGAHKTTAVHSVLADRLIAQFDLTFVPEPASVLLLTTGWVALFLPLRSRRVMA